MGRKLLLETTAPFQGLPELVAFHEGLFEAEGLDVEFIERGQYAPPLPTPALPARRWSVPS